MWISSQKPRSLKKWGWFGPFCVRILAATISEDHLVQAYNEHTFANTGDDSLTLNHMKTPEECNGVRTRVRTTPSLHITIYLCRRQLSDAGGILTPMPPKEELVSVPKQDGWVYWPCLDSPSSVSLLVLIRIWAAQTVLEHSLPPSGLLVTQTFLLSALPQSILFLGHF